MSLLHNLGYQWKHLEDYCNGVICHAARINSAYALTRKIREKKEFLFDPSLYLSELSKHKCENKTLARLTSYPWFNQNIKLYDKNSDLTASKWFKIHKEKYEWPVSLPNQEKDIKNYIKKCLLFQKKLKVTKYIIPVSLIKNTKNISDSIKWIRQGNELRREEDIFNDRPLLVSVPLLDKVIPEDQHILETIIDNIATLSKIDGIYALIVRSRHNVIYDINKKNIDALLKLSYFIGKKAQKEVIINFEDIFGLVCLSLGAKLFATGYNRKHKRFNFRDYEEIKGYPRVYPKFYSHTLIGDFLTETDLNKFVDNKLTSILSNDKTESSKNLLNALQQGKTAETVLGWEETHMNLQKAKKHRIQRIYKSLNSFKNKSDEGKIKFVRNWLIEAEKNRLYLSNRFSDDPLEDDGRHVQVWRKTFDHFIKKYKLL